MVKFEPKSMIEYPQILYWSQGLSPFVAFVVIVIWDFIVSRRFDLTLVPPPAFVIPGNARVVFGIMTTVNCISMYFMTGDIFKWMNRTARRKVKPFVYKLMRVLIPWIGFPLLISDILQSFWIQRKPDMQLTYHAFSCGLTIALFINVDIAYSSINRTHPLLYLIDFLLAADTAAYVSLGYRKIYGGESDISMKILAYLGFFHWFVKGFRFLCLGPQLYGKNYFQCNLKARHHR